MLSILQLMEKLEAVGELYENYPYPPVGLFSPFLQPIRRDDLPLLNYQAGYASCFGHLGGASSQPRILVAGCGTLEPVAVALANPKAQISAVDLSEASLEKLQWQAKMRGVASRIQLIQEDFQKLAENDFDYVVATGVLHHLPDPLLGARALVERAKPNAVFRFMVYSQWGRDLLYGAKALAEMLGAETPKEVRKLMADLPASHPYRMYFHLYKDSITNNGLADGYLHPCDQPFTALSLRDFLQYAGLQLGQFLHRPSGQPEVAENLAKFPANSGCWERLAVLEALGGLEENFCFFASRSDTKKQSALPPWHWNPALPTRGRFFSRLLEEVVSFDSTKPVPQEQNEKLQRALFLLPGGSV